MGFALSRTVYAAMGPVFDKLGVTPPQVETGQGHLLTHDCARITLQRIRTGNLLEILVSDLS